MSQLLDMLMHIADENSKTYKRPVQRASVVTAAMLEQRDWDAFKARIERRKKLLMPGARKDSDDEFVDMDEDDIDLLLAVVSVLERAKETRVMLTLSETMRELQRAKVVSLEFPASARAQTQRMLTRLRELNRAWSDSKGRWGLL